ncbi:cysteine--tRNA ligase [Pseudophaeobacter flagellatus]|uniref:hypothetical protein n=1 Tax=Pseudophaeobacter flagellatus TaxID=2899119 RepID=UPI001E2D5D78|nr:hypothetical protein [Pseudophaeobacter flagellatus]MCD9150153.1 hypothetical protein [Pseudophaeobacter flagellatus]
MIDIALNEGSLSFEFDSVEFAEKYDDWRHYRGVFNSACGSSKAVDFVVSKGGTLWLIEVKDYRTHARTKPSDLADEVMLKVRDTMAGLVSAAYVGVDADEKRTSRSALKKRKLKVVLHLEQPSKPSRLFPMSVDPADILMKLRQRLRFADCHPTVVDRAKFPNSLGRVSSI